MTVRQEKNNASVLIVSMPAAAQATANQLEAFHEWLRIWGILPDKPSSIEREFLKRIDHVTWPTAPIEAAHGPQLVPRIAEQSSDLVDILTEKQPTLLIFLSCYLWQAMNLARDKFSSIAGAPLEEGHRITDLRLGAYAQQWQTLTVLALPMPSKNTTISYIESLSQGVQEAFRTSRNLPTPPSDPLLERAARELVLDRQASIDRIRLSLHVDARRAERLYESLESIAYRMDGDQAIASN